MKTIVMILILLALAALFAGCDDYKNNPDFPFPEFNSGKITSPSCDEHNIRKTLTNCKDMK